MQVHSFIAIVKALSEANVKYIVVGGIAVNAHGFERSTQDVDLVIWLEKENIKKAFKALENIGYKPRVSITAEQFSDIEYRNNVRNEKGMIVLQLWSDQHTRTPLDIFVEEPFNFEEEYQQAFWQEIDNIQVPMVSLPTLVKLKKGANRPKDLADLADLQLIYGERFPNS